MVKKFEASQKWRDEVKIALIRKHETQSHMADKLGVSRTYISMVVSGHYYSPKIVAAISDYLNIAPDIYE